MRLAGPEHGRPHARWGLHGRDAGTGALPIRGSVIVVTGASSGIGRITAARLGAAGARLVLVGRDQRELARTAATSGGQVLVADLGLPGESERVAGEALAGAGRVDVLVNNAGSGWAGAFASMDAADIERLVLVNLLAPLRLTRALLPQMLHNGRGRIVNVASIVGHTGHPGEAVYAATKAGLVVFTESLRQELSGTGVSAALVTPGAIDTPFFARRGSPYGRAWPRPQPAGHVADAIALAITGDRAELFVPRWMRLPARLRGSAPALYRSLSRRFG